MAIDLLATLTQSTITEMVTFFVYREGWLNDQPCVDWRCGNQLIPCGAFFIGLIEPRGGMGMMNVPFMSDVQKHQLDEVVEKIMVRIGVDPTEANGAANALIEEGFVRFAKKDSPPRPIGTKVFELRNHNW